MHSFRLIIVVALIVLSFNAFPQNKTEYKKILQSGLIGKTFIAKSKEDTSWRTYMGKIYATQKSVKYYVIKEFEKYQASAIWHGHSKIYFFNTDYKLIATVDMSMPENLPYKLENNYLFFLFDNQTYKTKIEENLPKMIRIKSDWWEEVFFE